MFFLFVQLHNVISIVNKKKLRKAIHLFLSKEKRIWGDKLKVSPPALIFKNCTDAKL